MGKFVFTNMEYFAFSYYHDRPALSLEGGFVQVTET